MAQLEEGQVPPAADEPADQAGQADQQDEGDEPGRQARDEPPRRPGGGPRRPVPGAAQVTDAEEHAQQGEPGRHQVDDEPDRRTPVVSSAAATPGITFWWHRARRARSTPDFRQVPLLRS
ncbi:hypothetical protein Misp01_39600 [Microtetraspora sp. NBRC 13810]|nr:hypothetical protein Misp01_39600 [Microtetraspora sp. NBRC 13810]